MPPASRYTDPPVPKSDAYWLVTTNRTHSIGQRALQGDETGTTLKERRFSRAYQA